LLVSPLKGGIGSRDTGGSRLVSPVTGSGERGTLGGSASSLFGGCFTTAVSSLTVSMFSCTVGVFVTDVDVSLASGFLSTHDARTIALPMNSDARMNDVIAG
jgi:hypothetical protein